MGTFDNLGFIKQAAVFQCTDPPWPIFIQAAGEAAFPVIMEAATFSCLDFLRLRAGVSPWHARGLRALIDGINRPVDQDRINKVFKFLIPLEKALFFFFVVDLTTEFLARWQSQIFKLGGCEQQPDDCDLTGNNPFGQTTGDMKFTRIGFFPQSKVGNCVGTTTVAIDVKPGEFWTAIFSVSFEPYPGKVPIGALATRLRQVLPNNFALKPAEGRPPWFGNKFTVSNVHNGQNKRTGIEEWWFEAATDVPGHPIGGSCHISYSRFPIFNKGIIPVNCLGNPAPSSTIFPGA